MSPHIEAFFQKIELKLPSNELISPKTLVELGLVKSESTLARWRSHGQGPEFLQLSKGTVRYPRQAVLDGLRQTYQNPSKQVGVSNEL